MRNVVLTTAPSIGQLEKYIRLLFQNIVLLSQAKEKTWEIRSTSAFVALLYRVLCVNFRRFY